MGGGVNESCIQNASTYLVWYNGEGEIPAISLLVKCGGSVLVTSRCSEALVGHLVDQIAGVKVRFALSRLIGNIIRWIVCKSLFIYLSEVNTWGCEP